MSRFLSRYPAPQFLGTLSFALIKLCVVVLLSVTLISCIGGDESETDATATKGDANLKIHEPAKLGDIHLGADDSQVTIVEYASATCPHCASFHKETWPELKKEFIDTGKIKFIFREFPFDPIAAGAFMLGRCTEKGRYYSYIENMFHTQSDWARSETPKTALLALAKRNGFTQETFDACLTNQEILDGMRQEVERAQKEFGVNSTPTFFINGQKLEGAFDIATFRKEIEKHSN